MDGLGWYPSGAGSAAQGRAEEITGGRVGSPMCARIARTEGVSMTKAMIFISAPQYRQVRGKISNRRAMIVGERGPFYQWQNAAERTASRDARLGGATGCLSPQEQQN